MTKKTNIDDLTPEELNEMIDSDCDLQMSENSIFS